MYQQGTDACGGELKVEEVRLSVNQIDLGAKNQLIWHLPGEGGERAEKGKRDSVIVREEGLLN